MDVRDILDPRPHLAGQVALIHHGRQFTYQALSDQVDRLAHGLSKQLACGELLAIWMPNGPEIICLYLACLKTGIVPMPLHQGMKGPEVRQILSYARARLLIVSTPLMERLAGDLADTGIERVYAVGSGAMAPGCHRYADLAHGQATSLRVRTAAEDMAFVLHTSGSEGQPKGVMLSYRNLNHILDFRLGHTRLGPDSISVMASCLTQSVGLHQSLALLAAGGRLVLLDDYDIDQMVSAIHRHRPTHLIMVVNAFDRLLDHPALRADSLAHVRFAAVGADQVTPRVQERYMALTGKPLNVSYGLTESSWALVNLEGRPDKCLALGKPGPGVEIRLVDRHGRETATGETGEILIRSPRTMLGYLHNAELTQQAYVDGWLASGDLAYRDEDGYFWFAGRKKHIIVLSSGDTVSPLEVERAMLGHPAVDQCVVLAAAADGSEVPWAYVSVTDASLSETALQAYLRERISDYKVPHRIILVAEMPVGLTGKVRRHSHAVPNPYPDG